MKAKEKIRCFIAVDLPDYIKHKLFDIIKDIKQKYSLPLRWVSSEKYHITLKFLGEISFNRLERIKKILYEIDKENIHFIMNINSVGVFPSQKVPRVLWVGFNEKTGNLEKLYNFLEKSLDELGFKPEKRKFTPHITLARCKKMTISEKEKFNKMILEIDEKLKNLSSEKFLVNTLVLFKSELHPAGSIYTKLLEKGGLKNSYLPLP